MNGVSAVGDDVFRAAFKKSPNPAALISRGLVVLACNEAYERASGVTGEKILRRDLFEMFPGKNPDQRKLIIESFDYVFRSGRSDHIPIVKYSVISPGSGEMDDRYWTVSNVPLVEPDGSVNIILHCPRDVTDLVRLRDSEGCVPDAIRLPPASDAAETVTRWTRSIQDILAAEWERLRHLFQQAPGFICVLRGPDHVFELANDAYYQLVGHRDVLGRSVVDALPEVVSQEYPGRLSQVFQTGVPFVGRALPVRLQRTPSGGLELRYIDMIYQPIRDPDGTVTGIFVQGHDVTDTHVLAQEVAYRAAHDALTGLYNRREFERRIDLMEKNGLHALLYIDIDHFKIINDRCGHAAGDALLIQIARILQAHEGHAGLLTRLGGDEFALFLPNCSQEEALHLANRLCQAVRELSFNWQGRDYRVTVSIGLAAFGETEGMSFTDTLGHADAACFLAKDKGRNQVQISQLADEDVQRQHHDMDLVSRLNDYIRENRIVLFRQKIFVSGASDASGVMHEEILSRLYRPDGVLVMPAAFITAAERFGVIGVVDRHIITKVVMHLADRGGTGRTRKRYFVNVSGMTLGSEGFCEFVEELMTRCPTVSPDQICFEVTETAAIVNLGQTASLMQRLIGLGFRFALDDFGSGVASFTYLRRLPVHYVKIAGEFIQEIEDDPTGEVIVESVARVARSLGIQTIAEQVETPELVGRLRALGIDYCQGFGLHRPEPL